VDIFVGNIKSIAEEVQEFYSIDKF